MRHPPAQVLHYVETTDFPLGIVIALSVLLIAMQKLIKRKTTSVLYRENCGGILRNLASGFRATMSSVADFDLYDDLRERIFGKYAAKNSENEINDHAA